MNSDAGDTPLIHAARQGHTSIALYLLEHGADAFVTPSENQPSALHHAAGTGSFLPLCSSFVNSVHDLDVHIPPRTFHLRSSSSCLKYALIFSLSTFLEPNRGRPFVFLFRIFGVNKGPGRQRSGCELSK